MLRRNLPSFRSRGSATYLGFFQEIALVFNSGLVKQEVAHYMFGDYAVRCWENAYFWNGVNRDGPNWSLFRDFASRMEDAEQRFLKLGYVRSDFRL